MTVKACRLDELTPQHIRAWDDLAAHALEPNVWVEPGFLLEDAACSPGGDELLVAYDEDADGTWHAVLVWTPDDYVIRRRQIATASTHGAYLSTFSPRIALLVRATASVAALSRMLDALGRDDLPHALALDKVPHGPFLDALRAASDAVGAMMLVRPRGEARYAPANPDGDWEFGGARDARPHDDPLTRDYMRRLRRLSRGVDAAVETAEWSDRSDVVEVFADLQGRGWKGDPARGGDGLVLHPDRKEALTRTVRHFASLGRVRAITLHVDGEPLHLSLCLTSATGRGFGMYDAYDERYARFGPGVIGRMATVLSITHGAGGVDFDPSIAPEVEQSGHQFTQVVPISSALIVRRGMRDRMLVGASVLASQVRSRVAAR
ncbi:GNAT family N-acetyltransferase [Demequina muriae]|uniref:GNAT family N-acetyltransferase n=1 Tax=Demequina muriae TaxID=3051664 RepID=A0ABT8GJY9_9MICO|nr:GNAT family N-acetyltransferase [Demequina sp. EGI L300058]MDN4481752.1 GNAT family N-acetyltransferase [Demequina sp. EGI L300058]